MRSGARPAAVGDGACLGGAVAREADVVDARLAPGRQHAIDLAEGGDRVVPVMRRQRRDDEVGRAGIERDGLRPAVDAR